MRCDTCPLTAASTESLEQVFAKLARCNECELEGLGLGAKSAEGDLKPQMLKQGDSSRLVALLRQAGKESRKFRGDISRLKQELRDFQEGSDTDLDRIEKLEVLHTTAMRELESALAERDELVHEQSAAIRALSSPILEVSTGVLAVPIIGTLSEERTHDLMHDLLAAVIQRSAERVALDLTGLNALDETTAERIASLCKAVALIGAGVVISGLRPDVVSMLVA
jgi:anti-anti-sigma regulatory factor